MFSSVPSDIPEPQEETLFSETSAFTRIAAVTPKKHQNAVEKQPEEEDEQSSLLNLVAGLDDTVTELISNLKLLTSSENIFKELGFYLTLTFETFLKVYLCWSRY